MYLRRYLLCLCLLSYSSEILVAQDKRLIVDSLVTQALNNATIEQGITTILTAINIAGDCKPCAALCHAQVGSLYCEKGLYEEGYNHIITAVRLRRELGDSVRVAGNFSNIALYKTEEGKYSEALHYALIALDILEEQHKLRNSAAIIDTLVAYNLGHLYNTLSNLQDNFHNYEEGLRYARKNIDLQRKLGNNSEINDAIYTLANRYFSLYQDSSNDATYADSATLFYNRYLVFMQDYQDETDLVDLAATHHNLASLAINTQDFDTAWKEIALSDTLYRNAEDTSGIIDVHILKANAYIRQLQNYHRALPDVRTALSLMMQTRVDTTVQLEIYNLLSDCFQTLGKPDSALLYCRKAEHLYTSMFTSQQRRFNEIDRAHLERRSALEKNISQLLMAKSENRQRLLGALAAILALLITIGALFWRQREQRQQLRITQQNRAIEDTLKDAQVRFLQGIIEGQQIERNETKHVLHNDIANTVLSLSYEIENAASAEPQQQKWIADLRQLAAHTRRLSHLKGGIIHDIGLYEGVKDLFQRIRQGNSVEAEFVSNLHQKRLETTVEVELWHIVQELVGNTLKYAHASRIELSIEADPTGIYFTYNDNGDGFDTDQALKRENSMGLHSIIEKTQAMGGRMPDIISSPGHGLTVSIEIPPSQTLLS